MSFLRDSIEQFSCIRHFVWRLFHAHAGPHCISIPLMRFEFIKTITLNLIMWLASNRSSVCCVCVVYVVHGQFIGISAYCALSHTLGPLCSTLTMQENAIHTIHLMRDTQFNNKTNGFLLHKC